MSKQVAVITGGSRGIGRAIAIAFAENGYDIVINYTRNEAAALETQKELEALGAKAMIFQADVAKEEEVKNFAKAVIDQFGRVDALINNAGITRDNLIMRMKEDDFNAVVDVNMKGTFLCSKYFGKPMMKARQGSMINISSVIGVMGNAGQVNYAASKAGVIGITKSLAKEFSSRNLRVNAIAPGFIDTEMTKKLDDDTIATYEQAIPLGRLGQAEDVANLAVFLASEKAGYITGQVINVDGGMII